MFVRLAAACSLCCLVCCTALAQSGAPAPNGWKPASDKGRVTFRATPQFRPVQLPAPVDAPQQNYARQAAYPQQAAYRQVVVGQDSFGQTSLETAPITSNFQAATSLPAPVQPAAQANVQPAQIQAQTQQIVTQQTQTQPAQAQQAQALAAIGDAVSSVRPAAFTSGGGTLPNDHGQVWREYDISQYTMRVQGIEQPQQAIVDWIINETGTQVWFSEPLGLLSASRTTLRVYHTPQMQAVVQSIVDRFNSGQTNPYSFGVRLLTISDPNWRTKLHHMMKPVSVQTPGIQAWIMKKEDAAIFVTALKARTDYREYNSTNLLIHNGQEGSLAHKKPTSYIKNILSSGDAFGSYQPEMGQIDEGYNLSISPLTTIDNTVVDAVIKCKVDQIERLVPVDIEVASQLNPGQRVQVQVPQVVSWRVHERFRWPTDHVLIVSCGVVAKPKGGRPGVLGLGLPSVPNPLAGARGPTR